MMPQTLMSKVMSRLKVTLTDGIEKEVAIAESYYDAGNFKKAFEAYCALYDSHPCEELHIQIAWMEYAGLGTSSTPMAAINKLRKLESPNTLRAIGLMYARLKDYSEAKIWLEKSISFGCYNSYFSLGSVLILIGERGEAIRVYEEGASLGMLACELRLLSKSLFQYPTKLSRIKRFFSLLKIRLKAAYIAGFKDDISPLIDLYPPRVVQRREMKRLPRHP